MTRGKWSLKEPEERKIPDRFPNPNSTAAEIYGPAMELKDRGQAKAYFDKIVSLILLLKEEDGMTREKAEELVKSNLGYYAGYYDAETRERVEDLFDCEHPIFGKIEKNGAPSPGQAFEAGIALANEMMKVKTESEE